MHVNLDPQFVDKIVNEVKSQGVFDQFRKDSISDVDTKPAYQNLRQRVENSVSKFLADQKWTPETNKNQLRERLRSNLMGAGFLDVGVQRIVDQVVNPKIATVFQPQIEDIVYKYLGIEKPETKIVDEKILPLGLNGNLTIKTDELDLLPNDLEAVSPDSDKSTVKSEPRSESKNDIEHLLDDNDDDDDESPPFEPLERISPNKIKDDENSNNSHLSGLSGLTSQDSNKIKDEPINTTANNSGELTQESQLSQVSSNSHLSIVTNEEEPEEESKPLIKEETNVDISEEAQMPKFNENSNSNPTICAETLHFDIKKDEIKFEGTDRNVESNPTPIEEPIQNDSLEENKLPEPAQEQEQHTPTVDEISDATLNTENSSLFDDDSEKGLQIVEEPTESSITSQRISSKPSNETNIPTIYDNLTESNGTLSKTISTKPEEQNIENDSLKQVTNNMGSPIFEENLIKVNDDDDKSNNIINNSNEIPLPPPLPEIEKIPSPKFEENSIKKNNIEKFNEISLPPPLPQSNGDNNKSSSNKSNSKSRHSSSSSSQKKHSKDKRSDKDRDKNRKSSSSSASDVKKHSSSSSDLNNKHPRHSSQSSYRSTSNNKDHKSSSSSSHKSKHHSSDRSSSRSDKDKKKEKNIRSEKSIKSDKEKTDKSKSNDDHSLARSKTYRRKSTDSNDGDTNKDSTKNFKNVTEKNETASSKTNNIVSNSTNNTNDSAGSIESEQKTNDNITTHRVENLSKPIIVDNLNNMELVLRDCMTINRTIESEKSNLPETTVDDAVNISPPPLKKMKFITDDDTNEPDLEYIEITTEENQEFENTMKIFHNLLAMSNPVGTENVTSSSSSNNKINSLNSEKIRPKTTEENEKLNGKRKRKNDTQKSGISSSHKILDEQEIIEKSLNVDCFELKPIKKLKQDDINDLIITKVSPTPSEMSTGSKENEFSDKNGKVLKVERKEFLEKKSTSSSNVKGTQRYSSDDLYKPRPILSQRSRRRAIDGDVV